MKQYYKKIMRLISLQNGVLLGPGRNIACFRLFLPGWQRLTSCVYDYVFCLMFKLLVENELCGFLEQVANLHDAPGVWNRYA